MENGNVAEIFGEKVFNLPTMKARLPKDIYKSLLKTINDGSKLDISRCGSCCKRNEGLGT